MSEDIDIDVKQSAARQAQFYECAAAATAKAALIHLDKAEVDLQAARAHLAKAEAEQRTSELLLQRFQNENRPSIILKAQLTRQGDSFVATFGELSVIGETPEMAFQNFDYAWTGRE